MFITSKFIGINKGKEIYLPNKEYISGHRCKKINMVAKYIVHMEITAELKANWLVLECCLLSAYLDYSKSLEKRYVLISLSKKNIFKFRQALTMTNT